MGRKSLPHDDVVREMREHVSTANSLARSTISDDMDRWYVSRGKATPMERQAESVSEHLRAARELGEQLLCIGEPAAAAVAKGLRTTGFWRDDLMPFAERHRDLPVIRETLELLGKRKRDPLARRAAWLVRGRPGFFSAFIGGFMGESFEVALDGEVLVYKRYDRGLELALEDRFEPSPKDWRAFVETLRHLWADGWARSYGDSDVCDGTSWSIAIDAGDVLAASSGTNDYPDQFACFLEAVSRLIGGREFR